MPIYRGTDVTAIAAARKELYQLRKDGAIWKYVDKDPGKGVILLEARIPSHVAQSIPSVNQTGKNSPAQPTQSKLLPLAGLYIKSAPATTSSSRTAERVSLIFLRLQRYLNMDRLGIDRQREARGQKNRRE
jgi:hypothetical protein